MRKLACMMVVSVILSTTSIAQEINSKTLDVKGKKKSQFESIDLNTYKLTDFRYQILNIDFNLDNKGYTRNHSDTSSTEKSKYNGISTNGSGRYTINKNTRKYTGSHYAGLSYQLGYANTDLISNETENVQFSGSQSVSIGTSNEFFSSDNYFVGINYNASIQPRQSKLIRKDSTNKIEFISKRLSNDNNLNLTIGKGRIENVTDARLAIYILDDLIKQGRLSKTPTEEETFEFADFITKLLNKRVIDNRIKQLKECVEIDSFLVAKGWASKSDGLYFGLINDNWNYARLQSWYTGNRFYISFTSTLSYSNDFNKDILNNVNTSENRTEDVYYGINMGAGFNSKHIIGLKWQQNYYINSFYTIRKHEILVPDSTEDKYQSINGNIGYNMTFLPNTRTTLSANANMNIYKYFNKETQNRMNLYPTLSIDCGYYFSEKLFLSISSEVTYDHLRYNTPDETSKNLDYGFTAALRYYIF
jgi:hypothetical protein